MKKKIVESEERSDEYDGMKYLKIDYPDNYSNEGEYETPSIERNVYRSKPAEIDEGKAILESLGETYKKMEWNLENPDVLEILKMIKKDEGI